MAIVSIVLIGAAVWIGGQTQRTASDRGAEANQTVQSMLVARLDLETGLRGFLLSGRKEFLRPYFRGLANYLADEGKIGSIIDWGPEGRRLLSDQRQLTRRWLVSSKLAIAMRHDGQQISIAELDKRKHQMDRFRVVNASLLALGERKKSDAENTAITIVFAIIAGLGILGLLASYFLAERPGREAARRARQKSEFAEALQFGSDERETQGLLSRQLMRAIPDSKAIVFSSNNSENRLVTAADLPQGSALAQRLPTALPTTCLAIRQGGSYERREDKDQLIECELCGAVAANSLCLPSLVGGEVIGSVLVSRDSKPLSQAEGIRAKTTLSLAAPVLANLRNLAIAETRAVTDSLTGLSNVRAAAQDLARMAAFSGRTSTPMAAILLDIDHFKRVNDTFGHQIGDEVLAAFGDVLRAGTRTSDFVARYGGEEFLILLQDTDVEGGGEVAEKLRESLRQMHVPGLTGRVTASFGVASIPAHAGDADSLLRVADRALYAAKNSGRDKVCKAAEADPAAGVGPDTVDVNARGHISGTE